MITSSDVLVYAANAADAAAGYVRLAISLPPERRIKLLSVMAYNVTNPWVSGHFEYSISRDGVQRHPFFNGRCTPQEYLMWLGDFLLPKKSWHLLIYLDDPADGDIIWYSYSYKEV